MISLVKNVFHYSRRNIARFWLKLHPQVRVVGITGSYGKTNTARTVHAVLKNYFKTIITDTNLDTVYNLPITLLKINSQTEIAVLEYGIDQKGEMNKHLELVKPEIAIITGITPVHSDKNLLGSIEGIIKEKSKLLRSLPPTGRAILNFDDPRVVKMAKQAPCPIISYGSSRSCNFYSRNIKVTKKGTSFEVNFKKGKKTITKKVRLRLLGEHFTQAAMAALATAKVFGLNLNDQKIYQSLANLPPLPGRMSLEIGPKKSLLINDSLRANPASTIAGLKTLSALDHHGLRVAVLGEMGELGQYQNQEHYQIGQLAGQLKNLDYLVTIGPATKEIVRGAIKAGMKKEHIFYAHNHHEAAEVLEGFLGPNTLWYLKGSLLKHMERILLLLSGKEVACQKISCHNYYHCWQCKELISKK